MADYRGIFGPPPELEDFLAKETNANLNELEFFKNTVTPDVAERVGSLYNNYPSMNPKLGMYAGMMGVDPNSQLAFNLAQRNHDVFVKQNVEKIKKISKLKRGTQLGLLMLDLGFQPVSRNFKSSVVAAQETGVNAAQAVASNTSLGLLAGAASFIPGVDGDKAADRMRTSIFGKQFADKYKEAKNAYGPTEFNQAVDTLRSGKPLNLGQGYFPESTPLEETQKYRDLRRQGLSEQDSYKQAEAIYGTPITQKFEEAENQYKANTRIAGEVDISPGRFVAGQFFTKDDLGFAIGSTILDGAFRVFADPVNLGMGYMSGAKLGLRSLVTPTEQALFKTGQALDEAAKTLPLLPRLFKTVAGGKTTLPNGEVIEFGAKEARRLQFGRTAEEVLQTKRGDKFVNAMVEAKGEVGLAVLMDLPQFKNVDPRILRLFTSIENAEDMKSVLVSLLRKGNLANMTDVMKLRYGVTDEIVQALSAGGAEGLALPMKANLIPEAANAIARKITGEYQDIAPIRNAVSKARAAFDPKAGDDVFNGVLNTFGEVRAALPYRMRKYFDMAPSKYASIKNLGTTARNLDGIMKSGRLTLEQRGTYLKRAMDAESQEDIAETIRDLYQDVVPEIQKQNPNLEIDDIKDVMSFLADESTSVKSYFVTEKGEPMAFPGTKFKAIIDKQGKTVFEATPTAQMISEMVDNYIILIDYQELEKAFPVLRKIIGSRDSQIRKYAELETLDVTEKMLKRLGMRKTGFKTDPRTGKPSIGGGGKGATMDMIYQDYLMQRVLKPVWMLRGALTTRVSPEEMLRIIASGSRVGLNHPFHYYAMKYAAGDVVELQNPTGDVLWSTRLLKKEQDLAEEIFGSDFVQAAKADYRAVEKIIKNTKIGVNNEAMASDDFVSWVLKNKEDGRDFIFSSYEDLNIKPLTSNKGKIVLDTAGELISINKQGGSFNINTGALQQDVFSSVSPYGKLTESISEDVLQTIQKEGNLSEQQAIQFLVDEFLDPNTTLGVERLQYLRKENHSLGWKLENNAIQFDVSVSIPQLTDAASVKDIEKALVATAMLGIKGMQKDAFLSKEALQLIGRKTFIESDELQYWKQAIDEVLDPMSGDYQMGFLKFMNPDSPKFAKNPNRRVDIDDVVPQKILNALYDTNFNVAKAIRRKKKGIGNAAPNGSWLPMDENYLAAMASKAMQNFLQPEFQNQYKGVYKQYDKIVNGVVDESWKRGTTHQFMLMFKNPVSIKLANDGLEETLRYLLYNPEGQLMLKNSIELGDVRGAKAKAKLKDPIQLRNNLEALGYRMARLIGGEHSIKDPLTGVVKNEEWAKEIRFLQGGVEMYPLYEFDLNTGSKMGQRLLRSGGFYNGKDYLEYWQQAVSGKAAQVKYGALAQSSRLKKFYKDFYDLIQPDIDILPNKISGSYTFLDDIADYSTSQKGIELAVSKLDKFLEGGYTTFLTGPSDYLNRDPLWRFSLYEHGLEVLGLFDETTAAKWIRGSEKQLRGSKFGEKIIAEYRAKFKQFQQTGFADEITDMDQAMGILSKKAMNSVIDLLYSTSQRHVFSDMLSSYVPFPEIGAEVWKTWGGLLGSVPQKFNKTRVAFDAAEEGKPYDTSMGYFFRDPVTGKRMFSYPDPLGVFQKGFFGEDMSDQGIRIRPAGFLGALNLVTANGLLPSVGPKVTWTLEFFDRVITSLPYAVEKLFLGDFRTDIADPEEFMLQFIQPSLQKFFTQERLGANSTDKYDEQYNSSIIDTLAVMYAKGLIDPLDPAKADAEFDKFAEAANNQWLIRGLVQWSAPTGVQPRIELEDKNGNWWFVQTLTQEYDRILVENNYDYQITTEDFIDRFGINPIPLKLGKKKPGLKTPFTESAVEYWTQPENREVLESHPRTAYFTRPDTIDDKWVWADDFNAARDYYDAEDWDLLARQTLIERELKNKKEELQEIADRSDTDSYTDTWVNANYALERRKLEDKSGIPAFGPLGIGEIRADPKLTIMELYTWEDDERLKNSPEYAPLAIYLSERDKAEEVLLNGGEWRGGKFEPKTPTIYPIDSTSERAAWVRDQLKEIGIGLIEEYGDTYWNQLFYGTLYSEVDNTRK